MEPPGINRAFDFDEFGFSGVFPIGHDAVGDAPWSHQGAMINSAGDGCIEGAGIPLRRRVPFPFPGSWRNWRSGAWWPPIPRPPFPSHIGFPGLSHPFNAHKFVNLGGGEFALAQFKPFRRSLVNHFFDYL